MQPAEHPINDDPVERALRAFLLFRDEDMDLWRRASLASGLSHQTMLAAALILRADERGQPLRQVDVRTALRLSAAGASAIASELEGKGIIRRRRDDTDGRALLLVAGPQAAAVIAQLQQHDDEFRDLIADVPDEHLESFVRVLDGMRALNANKYR